MEYDEALIKEAAKILPVMEKIHNLVAASGLSVESGCYALASVILSALQFSNVIESDKRAIAQNIIVQLGDKFFSELVKYAQQSNMN